MPKTTKYAFKWMTYPKPISAETGCKVSWNTYATREEAEACAVAAKHNAVRQEALGYDFGYQSPGQIDTVPGTPPTYRVTLP